MGQLDGMVAVVTGGAAGIGAGIVEALANAGADVAACDIQADKLEAVAERARSASGRRIEAGVVDVREPDAVRAFVDAAAETFGGIDLVVANAGVWRPTDPCVDDFDTALDDWAFMVDTNLRGVYFDRTRRHRAPDCPWRWKHRQHRDRSHLPAARSGNRRRHPHGRLRRVQVGHQRADPVVVQAPRGPRASASTPCAWTPSIPR